MAALRRFNRLSCSITAAISRKASSFSLQEMTICNFRDSDVLDNWTCTSDEEFGGKSRAELVRTNTDHVSFKGVLSTELPLDRATKHSGFSAMRSNPVMNRWGTVVTTDISSYDVMQLRLRGDGRTYMVNIQPPGYNTDDMYQAFIYTRGGPLWEVITVPFSKFLLTTAGYLQDRQPTFHRIRTVGISLMDRINGPFRLELDYIKVKETFYQPKYFVEHAENEMDN